MGPGSANTHEEAHVRPRVVHVDDRMNSIAPKQVFALSQHKIS